MRSDRDIIKNETKVRYNFEENDTCEPSIYTIDHPKLIVLNQIE